MVIKCYGNYLDKVEMLFSKQAFFHKLKKGDKVKVPIGNKIVRVRVYEKYPNLITVMHKNGYRVCFSVGDVVIGCSKPNGENGERS